jgi:hypothetical protein
MHLTCWIKGTRARVWEGNYINDLQHFKQSNAGEEGACAKSSRGGELVAVTRCGGVSVPFLDKLKPNVSCFEAKLFFATDTTSQISRLFSPQFDAMSHSLNDVHFDTDFRFVVGRLMQELQQNGPRLCPHSEPMSLSKTSDGITITLKDGSTQGPFDQVRLNADRFA